MKFQIDLDSNNGTSYIIRLKENGILRNKAFYLVNKLNRDSYDFEESSYGEFEVAAAFHKSVYNMMTVDEIETFLY